MMNAKDYTVYIDTDIDGDGAWILDKWMPNQVLSLYVPYKMICCATLIYICAHFYAYDDFLESQRLMYKLCIKQNPGLQNMCVKQ